jgi:hypothetical protein
MHNAMHHYIPTRNRNTIGRVRPVTFEESSRAVSAPLRVCLPPLASSHPRPVGSGQWAGLEWNSLLPALVGAQQAASSFPTARFTPPNKRHQSLERERRTSHTTLITTHFLSLSLRPIDPGLPPPAPADRSPRLASYPAPSSSDARAEEFDPSARGKERETKEREGQTDRSGRYR